ncbi:MAG: ATP-binding protein [Pseudomonadota bacterium]
MSTESTLKLAVTSDPLTRQAIHLRQDFQSRVGALLSCMFLASVIAPFGWLLASLSAFFCTEITQFILQRRLIRGQADWEKPAYVANAFLAAVIFSSFPFLIWNSGTGAGYVMGLGMMLTAIIHCILIRSHHLGVCLATLAPLMMGTAIMVVPHVFAKEARSPADVTTASLVAAALYCTICVTYLVKAAIDQNKKHREMAEALERAEAANRAKDRFLTSMSHEIRTPLNGILGVAQISRDNAQDEPEIELAETLLASGHILKSMVDDILDHAKIEAGKMELHPEPTDLRHLCAAVTKLYAAHAEEKDLDLVVDVANDVPELVVADRLRLHQILANLVSNAVKFTSSGEVRITVSATQSAGRQFLVSFSVRDTGKGLTDAEMDTLFEPFSQVADEAELAAKGTGLGLPIARNLAHLMGGDIAVASSPDQGAQFTLTLHAESAESAASAITDGRPRLASSLDGLSVLVAEDNRTNRLILRGFLKGTGVHLQEVEHGAKAVEAARKAEFDVVLMDMRMPVMDGETAFNTIRADANPVPVVALTANAMPEDRERYLQMGMDGYLSKPLSKTALLRTLAEYHRDRGGSARITPHSP